MFRKKSIIAILLGAFIFLWGPMDCLYSGEGAEDAVQSLVEDKGGSVSTWELAGRIFIYLAILVAVGVVVLRFFKNGRLVESIMKKNGKLKVSETHVLGNKQFLVVVEYGKQKILLGVGPGMINKLCSLNDNGQSGEEDFDLKAR